MAVEHPTYNIAVDLSSKSFELSASNGIPSKLLAGISLNLVYTISQTSVDPFSMTGMTCELYARPLESAINLTLLSTGVISGDDDEVVTFVIPKDTIPESWANYSQTRFLIRLENASGAHKLELYQDISVFTTSDLVAGSVINLAVSKTIAGGAFTATGTAHSLLGEGGAADELATINGGVPFLILFPEEAAQDITLKHGTGNVITPTAADHVMADTEMAILYLDDDGNYRVLPGTAAVLAHSSSHERGGSDAIDGDHLDITLSPANYTPSTSPAEAAHVDDLAAHLAGLDEVIATLLALAGGTMTGNVDMNGAAKILNLLGLTLPAATELTISGDAITPTSFLHSIDTEVDAVADDLDTISTWTGFLVLYLENTGRVVTLKHGTSANNIRTPDAGDLEMTANGLVLLYRKTTSAAWRVIASGGGGGGDMLKSVYDSSDDGTVDPAAGGTGQDTSSDTGAPLVTSGAWSVIKDNLNASVAPDANDDSGDGYAVGSKWYDLTADKAYVCLDATSTAAVWKETTGSGSGIPDVVSDTSPQAGGAFDMNSFALLLAKGADLASATNPALGATTDGNYRDITGTTQIDGFDTVAAGITHVVRFTGILQLTHHSTSMILPSGANITTAAGDAACFVSLGSGNWRCLWYTRADGTALVAGSAGKRYLTIPAGAIKPATTTGPAAGDNETTTNGVNFDSLDFDGSAGNEIAWFQFDYMPDMNLASGFKIKLKFIAGAGASASDEVRFHVSAVAVGDNDDPDATTGTAEDIDDTIHAAGDLHVTPASDAITAAGTPTVGDVIWVRVERDYDYGSPAMAEDALLVSAVVEVATANAVGW